MRHKSAQFRIAVVLAWLLAAAACAGCGGQKQGKAGSPQNGIELARQGNYKVKIMEGGEEKAVALFHAGSFRLVAASRPHLVIYNAITGGSWFYYISTNTIKEIRTDEAAAYASLLPSKLLEPYIEMNRFWSEEGFIMDTKDGGSIRIKMEGPQRLPSSFEVYRQGRVFRKVEWSYSRMGEVGQKNFEPPEGAATQ